MDTTWPFVHESPFHVVPMPLSHANEALEDQGREKATGEPKIGQEAYMSSNAVCSLGSKATTAEKDMHNKAKPRNRYLYGTMEHKKVEA